MKKVKVKPTVIKDYNSERADIFLRVKGRLPSKRGDKLTREILDDFIFRYFSGELYKGMFTPKFLYDLITSGKISVPLIK